MSRPSRTLYSQIMSIGTSWRSLRLRMLAHAVLAKSSSLRQVCELRVCGFVLRAPRDPSTPAALLGTVLHVSGVIIVLLFGGLWDECQAGGGAHRSTGSSFHVINHVEELDEENKGIFTMEREAKHR